MAGLSPIDMHDPTRARRLALPLLLALLAGCSDVEPAWSRAAIDDLDGRQRQQFARAEQARDALGKQLLSELQHALADGGPGRGIEVCSQRAPAIAAEVSERLDLRVGRTSHRLRNPANAPPAWATEAVAAERPGPEVYRGSSGGLGALFPIRLQPQCLMCHGAREQLAPAAREALERDYPADRATGFAADELRGWFWVEVE